jgi:hypothetical protein
MPQLTFPITGADLRVDVRVNLPGPDLLALRAANRPAPPSFLAMAGIDTGSNVTGVSVPILQQLSLIPVAQTKTHGIGGQVPVRLFRVSITIFDSTQPNSPWFTQPNLVVMELPPSTPVDVLIGMDVLLTCRMLLDGPGRQFTLDY